MGMFGTKTLDSMNQAAISKITFIESELKRLTDEASRIAKLTNIFRNELTLAEKNFLDEVPIKIAESAEEVDDDYRKNDFSGEKVKETVSAVRSIFFDDHLDAFRDFACSSVSFMYTSSSLHCVGLDFLFESLSDRSRAFTLLVPTNVVANLHTFDFELDSSEDAFSNIRLGARMQLKIRCGSRENDNVVFVPALATLSYNEMARVISDYVVLNRKPNDKGDEL